MCGHHFGRGCCVPPVHGGGACGICGCSPCRCGPGFRRRFRTDEEEVEEIEEYIKELEKEVEGARRRLKELGGK